MEEARTSARELLSFFPAFSLKHFQMAQMFRHAEDTERVMTALRDIGLPE
jgi:hypothetical protein